MASVKYSDIVKIGEKCKNGFFLDVEHLAAWGEKQIGKDIELENGNLVRCIIGYDNVFEHYRKTGVRLCVEISTLKKTSSKLYIEKSRKIVESGEIESRRNVNKLCEISANYPDEKILKLAEEEIKKLSA